MQLVFSNLPALSKHHRWGSHGDFRNQKADDTRNDQMCIPSIYSGPCKTIFLLGLWFQSEYLGIYIYIRHWLRRCWGVAPLTPLSDSLGGRVCLRVASPLHLASGLCKITRLVRKEQSWHRLLRGTWSGGAPASLWAGRDARNYAELWTRFSGITRGGFKTSHCAFGTRSKWPGIAKFAKFRMARNSTHAVVVMGTGAQYGRNQWKIDDPAAKAKQPSKQSNRNSKALQIKTGRSFPAESHGYRQRQRQGILFSQRKLQ